MVREAIGGRSVYRYEIPVDDQWWFVELSGPIIHVATRSAKYMEIWALTGAEPKARSFRVFGTGQPLPDDAPDCLVHIGSDIVPGGALVWHLFEAVR
jgi:hypothetical protein